MNQVTGRSSHGWSLRESGQWRLYKNPPSMRLRLLGAGGLNDQVDQAAEMALAPQETLHLGKAYAWPARRAWRGGLVHQVDQAAEVDAGVVAEADLARAAGGVAVVQPAGSARCCSAPAVSSG